MFKVEVAQLLSRQRVTITIYKDTDMPSVKIFKRYDFDKEAIAPALVFMNVAFADRLTADEAYRAEEWYHIAAATAGTLDRIFQTREDLRRLVAARMVGKTVTIDFVE